MTTAETATAPKAAVARLQQTQQHTLSLSPVHSWSCSNNTVASLTIVDCTAPIPHFSTVSCVCDLGFGATTSPRRDVLSDPSGLSVRIRTHHNDTMTSYFSSITSSSTISNLGTRLNSLRRAITLGDEADDPDEENSSHISNVLRAYYTERGRPFPAWLPPDPKNPTPQPMPRVVATSQIQPNSAPGMPAPAMAGPGRGGGLSDLWGDSGSGTPPATQTASLRRGRLIPGGGGAPLAAASSAPSGPMGSPMGSPGIQTPGAGDTGGAGGAGGRPLHSQRLGSHQMLPTHPPPPERMTSAQDRLRARLQGGRSPSPGQLDPSVRKPVGGMAAGGAGARWGSR